MAVTDAPLDPWAEVQRHQAENPARAGRGGATCVFVGTMRDFNEGDGVEAMELEHYPAMTQAQLEAIGREALSRWAVEDVLLVHRHGRLRPGDPIVVVAAWAAHREAAFAACRHLIEALKERAPFWKKEHLPGGSRWVRPKRES